MEKVDELIGLCATYLRALHFESERKALLNSDVERSLYLACRFAFCNLNNEHKILALRSALSQAYKQQCIALAGKLAKILLSLEPSESVATQAQKVISLAESLPLNHKDPLHIIAAKENDLIDSFNAAKLVSDDVANCAFCSSTYSRQEEGNTCKICLMGRIF